MHKMYCLTTHYQLVLNSSHSLCWLILLSTLNFHHLELLQINRHNKMPRSEHTSLHNSKRERSVAQSNHQSSKCPWRFIWNCFPRDRRADLNSCAANTDRFSTRYSDCGKEESVIMGVWVKEGPGTWWVFSCLLRLLHPAGRSSRGWGCLAATAWWEWSPYRNPRLMCPAQL